MKMLEYVIKDSVGIHARPAGLLVKQAKQYESKIVISCGDKSAEATKLMALMAMGIKTGQTVKIKAEGPDEDAAYEAMKRFFEENL